MSRMKQFLGAIPIAVLLAFSAAYADPPVWDTVSTACVSLKVAPDGSFGGGDGTQGLSMDYYPADCDPSATRYLYSGSPVVMWLAGTDTVGNWSIYGNDCTTPVGFYPVSHTLSHPAGDSGEVFSGLFLTHDSSIAIEKTWYAPQEADSCNFVIQMLRVWSNDGLAHSGITVGEAVDWDIPADSLMAPNGSSFNSILGMIYQYGGEYHQDDAVSCQDNDARFGGMRYLSMFSVAADTTPHFEPWSAHTRDNPTYVYGNDYGFVPAELYQAMADPGWSQYFSPGADSLIDLHTTMTFVHDYDLAAAETLVVYTAFVTVQNGTVTTLTESAEEAKQWAANHVMPQLSCCRLRGDFNDNGAIQVSDLTSLIGFLFRGGPPPACFEHGDVNGDGKIDITDMTGGVIPFLFRGGWPIGMPAPC